MFRTLYGGLLVLGLAVGTAAAQIEGTAGNDTLNGTGGKDTINGLGGNDTINGMGGDDTITGGAGMDTINGGDGNDIIEGGDDNDGIVGGQGNDTIDGGAGNDAIDGGPQDDKINGGAGDDNILGGEGNDKINGGEGNDTINGGNGNDRIRGGGGVDIYNTMNNDGNDRYLLVAGDVPAAMTETVSCGSGKDTVSLIGIPGGNVVPQVGGGWMITDPDSGGMYDVLPSCETLHNKAEEIVMAVPSMPVDAGTTALCAWTNSMLGPQLTTLTDTNFDFSVRAGIPFAHHVTKVSSSRDTGLREVYAVADLAGGPTLSDLGLFALHNFEAQNPGVKVVALVDVAALLAEPSYPFFEGEVVNVVAGITGQTAAIRFKDGATVPPGLAGVQQLLNSGFANSLPNFNGNVVAISPDVYDAVIGDYDCNGNDHADQEDIANGISFDCNNNLEPDDCDIARGYSNDADSNSIPDECSSVPALSNAAFAVLIAAMFVSAAVVLRRRAGRVAPEAGEVYH